VGYPAGPRLSSDGPDSQRYTAGPVPAAYPGDRRLLPLFLRTEVGDRDQPDRTVTPLDYLAAVAVQVEHDKARTLLSWGKKGRGPYR